MTRCISVQSEDKLYIEKVANCSCKCTRINKEEDTTFMTSVYEITYRLQE
jgi:hypothetical protein